MTTKNADLKPIKLYAHGQSPNPWKVVSLLKELSLPYKTQDVEFSAVKQEPYISVNPNGRLPAIEDPNTGTTIWESNAILLYLTNTYDPSHNLSFSLTESPAAHAHMLQWLFFQASGQGVPFGQAVWFQKFHHEKVPSAIERYQKEAERVVGVVDLHLTRTGQDWLVADGNGPKEGKCTIADLSFIPWGRGLSAVMGGRDVFEGGKYPAYKAWFQRMLAREGVHEMVGELEVVERGGAH